VRQKRTPNEEETKVSKRNKLWALAAAGVLAMSGLAACGDDDDDGGGGGGGGGDGETPKVAVLLPDSKSSVRWETVDRPLLQKAFDDAGVDATITNAEANKSTQQQQAEQAILDGAQVILLVNLDSGSGAAIAGNAQSQGVKVIDYDRLTLETDATDYYVSFDNEKVGELQGQGLVDCIGDKQGARIAVLNGSPTDNNATLFKNGYDSVINPKFKSGD
jgi:D-xylose transport system substrate-binding protein